MKKDEASSTVVRCLPRYHRHLNGLYLVSVERILSDTLGRSMGLAASQIRQDPPCFGGFNQRGYDYNIESLRGEVSDALGMDRDHNTVILGTSNPGRALMENFHFKRPGVTLSATFDVTSGVAEQGLSGTPVHHVDQLEEHSGQHPASIGMLTVPRSVANRIAGRLVASGVRGIWNFTNVELTADTPDVVIENVHFVNSLLALSYMIPKVP